MDDEKSWQERTEHQRLTDKIEDLQDRIRELEITLHGKRAKTGLLAEYERHDELLGRLYAIIWQDPTGQKGMLHDIDILMGRKTSKERATQYKWQFWGLILATIISSLTALLVSWDKILKLLPKDHPDKVTQLIEEAKHPRIRKSRIRLKKAPLDNGLVSPINPSPSENPQ